MIKTTHEKLSVSIIYLTYNGLNLVKETLPILIKKLSDIKLKTELIVVDNGSNDGVQDYLKSFQNSFIYIRLDSNLGFAKGSNIGAKKASSDFIFFINNDIKIKDDFLTPLLKEYIKHDNVFAVGPKFLRWDEKTIDDGIRTPIFWSGLVDAKLETDNLENNQEIVFILGGGFLVKTNHFFNLNGFDEIYSPFSWEDLDLSYRAYKRGYKNYFCPKVILYHKRSATAKTHFDDSLFKSIVWRNKFIFMWTNFTDLNILLEHFSLLPFKLIKFLFNGRSAYVIGFFKALLSIKEIMKKRNYEKKFFKLKDKNILKTTP